VLRLSLRDDAVTLAAEDDGIGFDASSLALPNRGLGLLSMRERTELLGGSFNLVSAPGQGTRISIAVPLSRETQT
jgi:signal transduction histidine kinase